MNIKQTEMTKEELLKQELWITQTKLNIVLFANRMKREQKYVKQQKSK